MHLCAVGESKRENLGLKKKIFSDPKRNQRVTKLNMANSLDL
jgi:hypothetical protein